MKMSVSQYLFKNLCVCVCVPPYVHTCILMCVCVCVLPSCWAVQCGVVRGDILLEGRWKCSAAPVSWRDEDKMRNTQGWFIDISDHQNVPNSIKGHPSLFAHAVYHHAPSKTVIILNKLCFLNTVLGGGLPLLTASCTSTGQISQLWTRH